MEGSVLHSPLLYYLVYSCLMDAFLSDKALRAISATEQVLLGLPSKGFLIGHKRGPSYIVEEILPCSETMEFSPNVFSSGGPLEDEIIGFILFNHKSENEPSLLSPWAFGKLLIEVGPSKKKPLSLDAFVIVYDKRFSLKKIKTETYNTRKCR